MARSLTYSGSGVNTYLQGLLHGTAQINPPHEIIVLTEPGQTIPDFLHMAPFQVRPIPPHTQTLIGRLAWDHWVVGRTCKRLGVDVLLAPAHVRPAYAPCPVVVTIHDMMYHLFPQDWGWSDRLYFRTTVTLLTSRASAIAADSENTRQDILRLLRVPEERVAVIHLGIPEGYGPMEPATSRAIRVRYNLQQPFILYTGSSHPRKNLMAVVEAFEAIADDVPHDLVLKVSRRWPSQSICQRVQNSRVASRIRLLEGLFPISELAMLYNEADVFVYPSLYEGFGLPVLEALACGCPTITSNISSLPEVAGEAALLVPPRDIPAIAEVIRRVLTDPGLRNALRQRALQQAQKFSWIETARKTLQLMEKAACS
jgi:glycosyltransferase involved in cell wall biosynthesis